MSTLSLSQIMIRPAKFAFTYTLGNVLSICSLMFLMGPCNQIKKMFDADRWIATTVYLGSMAATLFCVITGVPGIFVLPMIFFQFCSLMYYSATYIPYGREILAGCASSACGVLKSCFAC